MSVPDAKTRFTDRAADYVAGRPTYPSAVLTVLHRQCGFDAGWKVADVGAGTGLSAALFLGHGNAVTAVEPNDAMRAAADARFADHARYDSVAAPAEATGLPDGSVDLVVAAQAFHWFDPAAFARECRRLLTPRGRVLLMWNAFRPDATPAAGAYGQLMERHAVDLARVAETWEQARTSTAAWFRPEDFAQTELSHGQRFADADGLLLRLASSSYMPGRDHPGFDAMRRDVHATFRRHTDADGYLLPYACRLFLGVPRRD